MRHQHRLAIVASVAATLVVSAIAKRATAQSYGGSYSYCQETHLCADPADGLLAGGQYVGHDEPALLFYSPAAGSGNSSLYYITLPKEPTSPSAVHSFRLYTAFWLGMALCDSQSAPQYTHAQCKPDNDSNIFDGSDPSAPDYAGHRPGGAYMELQFYPPATSIQNPLSCDPGKWCAAMNVDSYSADETGPTAVLDNFDCVVDYGEEPVNFAWVTRSGNATAGEALVNESFGTAPVTSDVLLMNPGDQLAVSINDTPAGLQVSIEDFSSGQIGSMIANGAHGFQQVVYDPSAESCTTNPYTFRAMFATSSPQTRVWTAHTYNVAFSMEIGHQTQSGYAGGTYGDTTFTGPSYVHDWPGSLPPSSDSTVHPTSIAFPSPLFTPTGGRGTAQYNSIAFEADMPVFESADAQACNPTTGANCTNPPQGAAFYPIYSTAGAEGVVCLWHFGDTQIADTTDLFGGDSTIEYGSLLDTFFPTLGFQFDNYRNIVEDNPCPYEPILPPNVRTIPQPIPPEETIIDQFLILEEEVTLVTEGMPISQVIQVGEGLNDILLGSILQTELGSGVGASGGGAAGDGS
jgi:hypothetical protein